MCVGCWPVHELNKKTKGWRGWLDLTRTGIKEWQWYDMMMSWDVEFHVTL